MNQSQRSLRPSASMFVCSVLVCSLAGSGIVGCGVDAESLQTLQRVSLQQSRITQGFDTTANSEIESNDSKSATFRPTFPDREDPFHVDSDVEEVAAQTSGSAPIQVLGFANRGKQQAILRIGEETKFVVAGDRVGTIEIVSISPPRVRLRNDNLTWDASMFQNQTISPNGDPTR